MKRANCKCRNAAMVLRVLLSFCFVTGVLTSVSGAIGAPMTMYAGDTLSVGFSFDSPFLTTPNLLSFGFNTDYAGTHTTKIYDGNTLLGTNTFESGGSISGFFKTADNGFSFGNPAVVDFSSIINRSINGRIDFSITSGSVQYDPTASVFAAIGSPHVYVGTCPTPYAGTCPFAGPAASITSITLNSSPPPPPTCIPPQVQQGNVCIAPPAPIMPGFAERISNSWLPPTISENHIEQKLHPDLSGLAYLNGSLMNALATLGGFDHFNIEQNITYIDAHGMPLTRGLGYDPLLGGNGILQPADYYSWYYDEVPVDGSRMGLYNDPFVLGAHEFLWTDTPDLGSLRAGTTVRFTDYLVGVYADHTGIRISDLYPDAKNINFTWEYVQGFLGSSSGDVEIFAESGLPSPGFDGSINFLGYFGNDPNSLSATSASIPEPTTLVLIILGLAGLASTRHTFCINYCESPRESLIYKYASSENRTKIDHQFVSALNLLNGV